MYIKSLRICNGRENVVIREVVFRNGANFIVDAELSDRHNKVGKTTFLKLIDIMMGAKNRDDLYRDRDAGIVDHQLKNLIDAEKVFVELTLVDALDDTSSEMNVLKVELFKRGKYFINGNNVSSKKYRERLNEFLFARNQLKPTVRQLIGSFVRVSLGGDKSAFLRYLPYMKIGDYRALYNFLFRVSDPELDQRRVELSQKIEQITDAYKQFDMLGGDAALRGERSSRDMLLDKYHHLCLRLDNMMQSDSYLENARIVYRRRSEYQKILDELGRVDYHIDFYESALASLAMDMGDLSLHKAFYDEVSPMLSQVHRSFEELVRFNRVLRANKRDYLNELLSNLYEKREQLTLRKNELIEQYGDYLSFINDGSVDDYQSLLNELLDVKEHIGKWDAYDSIGESFDLKISVLRSELDGLRQIDDRDGRYIADPEMQMDKFNGYFTPLARRINGEVPVLRYNVDDSKFPLEIEGVSGSSTGTRKSLVAAFDLAYQEFSRAIGIRVPHFVVHDVVETIEGEVLRAIVSESNRIGCQYIVAVLREKLISAGISKSQQEDCTVIELSESDKLFEGLTVDAALRSKGTASRV